MHTVSAGSPAHHPTHTFCTIFGSLSFLQTVSPALCFFFCCMWSCSGYSVSFCMYCCPSSPGCSLLSPLCVEIASQFAAAFRKLRHGSGALVMGRSLNRRTHACSTKTDVTTLQVACWSQFEVCGAARVQAGGQATGQPARDYSSIVRCRA